MPASPTQAAFAAQEFRVIKSGPDAAVVAKYGDKARSSTEIIPTFFEAEADAQAILTARHALLSPDRRRFTTSVSGEQTGIDIMATSATTTVTLIDDERDANLPALVSDVTISLKSETTKLEVWG